ncbi:LPXTG-site transpeptidase (sortase) family protein [Streptomyces aidingensis]|uniref:LPXTG-site transpeptidase (Sortase) family protein n=2 Tax=Streptomyces aidingensis TaxID=910347 RepID=A0A1I1HIA5_9ACTN|nr:LPXTG-site transpeptidase (sortase) family protein [Streptomyces aidingensis]
MSPADPAVPSPPPADAQQERQPLPDARFAVPGAALLILAALLLGFAANLTVVSHLQHARAQQTGFAELREQLALGTAPVGQTDYRGHPLDPGAPVALLRIPALDLREVVFEGTTPGVLTAGPGHRRDTVLPGQAGTSVLMGRQWAYGGPFRELHTLAVGDTVEITTGQGEHVYRVTGLRYPGDEVPAPAGEGEGRLTLITATGGPYTPSDALRVDAELTTGVQPAPARIFPVGSLGPGEETLEGDSRVWIQVLLWSQGLLLAALAVTWAYRNWGRAQAWIVGVPLLGGLSVGLSGALTMLLPNLL